MARITVSAGQLAGLVELIRGFVRFLRRLVFVAVAAAVLLAVLLQRDGFTETEVGLTIVCLVPPAFLLFFAQSINAVLSVPDRLRRMPGDGQERLAELTRVAGEARTARARRLPLLLWRLRGAFASVRDVAGVAVPLRAFTPGFLALAALSAALCILLPAVVLVALLVIAIGA